jgi:hypothetical protein
MTLRTFSAPAGAVFGIYPTTPDTTQGYQQVWTVTQYGWTTNAYTTTVPYVLAPTYAIAPPLTGQLWPRSAQRNLNFS